LTALPVAGQQGLQHFAAPGLDSSKHAGLVLLQQPTEPNYIGRQYGGEEAWTRFSGHALQLRA
jgi:hypothetical protein